MKAIQVKVLPATNTKGTRLKAFVYGGQSLTQGRDYSYEIIVDAANVAHALACKLGWTVGFVGGTLPNGDWVFVAESGTYFKGV